MQSSEGYNLGEIEKLDALLKGFQGEALNGVQEWPTYIADRFELSQEQTIFLDGLYQLLPFTTFSLISEALIEHYEDLTSDWKDDSAWVEERTHAFYGWLENELRDKHNLGESNASAVAVTMGVLIHRSGYMTPVEVDF